MQERDPIDVERNKNVAAFSYVPFVSFALFGLKRSSPFIRFHARQGMILTLLAVLFFFIPYAARVLELFVLVGVAAGFVGAAQGRWYLVPFAGALSEGRFIAAFADLLHAVIRLPAGARSLWQRKNTRQKGAVTGPASAGAADVSMTPPLQEQEEAQYGVEK